MILSMEEVLNTVLLPLSRVKPILNQFEPETSVYGTEHLVSPIIIPK